MHWILSLHCLFYVTTWIDCLRCAERLYVEGIINLLGFGTWLLGRFNKCLSLHFGHHRRTKCSMASYNDNFGYVLNDRNSANDKKFDNI